jgi:hypothetical protein
LDIESRGPYLAGMEWEALQDKWEIDDLKESPALPRGAEKISIWRNDQYKIEARVTGTPTGTGDEMLPDYGGPATIMPNIEIEGSGMHGSFDYRLSHCVPGRISERRGESFEVELTTHSVRRMLPRRGPATPAWLTEWYLNGYPGRSFIYPRLAHRELKEEYRKEREFIGLNEMFEGAQSESSNPCAFVETSEVNFVVEPVPDKLGPPWSTCLGIEYREDLGGIPDADVRNVVAEIVGFVMGRPLIHVGYTSFAGRGVPIEQVVISPLEEDPLHISRRTEEPPVRIDKGTPSNTFEVVLRELVPNYFGLTPFSVPGAMRV